MFKPHIYSDGWRLTATYWPWADSATHPDCSCDTWSYLDPLPGCFPSTERSFNHRLSAVITIRTEDRVQSEVKMAVWRDVKTTTVERETVLRGGIVMGQLLCFEKSNIKSSFILCSHLLCCGFKVKCSHFAINSQGTAYGSQ